MPPLHPFLHRLVPYPSDPGILPQRSYTKGHAMSVMGFTKDGSFLLRNPQVEGVDVWKPGSPPRDSSPEVVGVELSQMGYSAMKPEVFLSYL